MHVGVLSLSFIDKTIILFTISLIIAIIPRGVAPTTTGSAVVCFFRLLCIAKRHAVLVLIAVSAILTRVRQ